MNIIIISSDVMTNKGDTLHCTKIIIIYILNIAR